MVVRFAGFGDFAPASPAGRVIFVVCKFAFLAFLAL
jgi:hypothetical protein